jgi:hypothetical protein
MKPPSVIQAEMDGKEVLRQGDLFLIPTEITDEDIKMLWMQYPEDFEIPPIQKQHYYKFKYGWEDEDAPFSKKLKRPEIRLNKNGVSITSPDFNLHTEGTRHEASRLTYYYDEPYIKKTIFHPQHTRIQLGDTWYKVVQNTTKQNRSLGGGVD